MADLDHRPITAESTLAALNSLLVGHYVEILRRRNDADDGYEVNATAIERIGDVGCNRKTRTISARTISVPTHDELLALLDDEHAEHVMLGSLQTAIEFLAIQVKEHGCG